MPGSLTDPSRPAGPIAAARAWDRFFFTPADPRPLALIRIATGLLLLWSLGWLGADLHAYLGSDGWADPDAVRFHARSPQNPEPWIWSIWSAVPDGGLRAAWVAAMAIVVLMTLGLFSPVTMPLAWMIAVSTVRRAPMMVFGFDGMVATWAFCLAVTGAGGRAFSLDRRLFGRGRPVEPTVSANLGLRLIQLHLCLIYAFAGLAKLRGARGGTARP